MKQANTFLTVALALLAYGNAQAQLVALTDENGATVSNGATVTVTGQFSDTTLTMGLPLAVENVSGANRLINVKRYELDVPAGTGNYFCWYQCYGEEPADSMPTWVAPDPIAMADGESVYGFHAYYRPLGIAGDATFRYVWYNMGNENDSNWVDIKFSAMPVGIAENSNPVRNFGIYPNPATGGDITFNYDLASTKAGTQLAVYNVLGERKLVRGLNAAEGKLVLPEGELASGVWFAVLERNGKALATKRVVVSR